MQLYIIGGSLRNRRLKTPSANSNTTRPTTALLRKSVFDSLAPIIQESTFLDLFAGTGAMGIEALSRGALCTTFVEKNREALSCIRDNLKTLALEKMSSLLQYDVYKALALLEKKGDAFDIIYSDPPYEMAHMQSTILSFLDTSLLIKKGSIVFLEEGAPSALKLDQISVNRLIYKSSRKFGKSLLHQYVGI